jgi:hypothetical protein
MLRTIPSMAGLAVLVFVVFYVLPVLGALVDGVTL